MLLYSTLCMRLLGDFYSNLKKNLNFHLLPSVFQVFVASDIGTSASFNWAACNASLMHTGILLELQYLPEYNS